MGETMKRILLAALIAVFAAGTAMAQSCDSQAMSKDGKPFTAPPRPAS